MGADGGGGGVTPSTAEEARPFWVLITYRDGKLARHELSLEYAADTLYRQTLNLGASKIAACGVYRGSREAIAYLRPEFFPGADKPAELVCVGVPNDTYDWERRLEAECAEDGGHQYVTQQYAYRKRCTECGALEPESREEREQRADELRAEIAELDA